MSDGMSNEMILEREHWEEVDRLDAMLQRRDGLVPHELLEEAMSAYFTDRKRKGQPTKVQPAQETELLAHALVNTVNTVCAAFPPERLLDVWFALIVADKAVFEACERAREEQA